MQQSTAEIARLHTVEHSSVELRAELETAQAEAARLRGDSFRRSEAEVQRLQEVESHCFELRESLRHAMLQRDHMQRQAQQLRDECDEAMQRLQAENEVLQTAVASKHADAKQAHEALRRSTARASEEVGQRDHMQRQVQQLRDECDEATSNAWTLRQVEVDKQRLQTQLSLAISDNRRMANAIEAREIDKPARSVRIVNSFASEVEAQLARAQAKVDTALSQAERRGHAHTSFLTQQR